MPKRNLAKDGLTNRAPKNPFTHVVFPQIPQCPTCGDYLELKLVKSHWFPYNHADVSLYCIICCEWYAFGIPMNRHSGLSLIIFDTNPLEAVKKMLELEQPECPWHKKQMIPTKIFGDWIPDGEKVEYQWKCSECFLTRHKEINRSYDHGGNEPEFSEEERQVIKQRLINMGYLEDPLDQKKNPSPSE